MPPAVSIHELRAREGRAKRGWIGLVLSTLLMVGFLWFLTQSWVIAVSLMFALLVHEYGHVLAMNRLGMGPARIYVIPFLGGLAKATHEPKNEWIGVLVSLAGPAFGLLAMVPLVAIGLATGDGQWMAAAFFVAMLNLINLVPAPPLDGSKALGPVLARVHPQLEKLVLLVIGVAVVVWGITTGRYILAVFLGLAIWGHLSKGGLRSVTGPLSWKQAGLSLGLFVLTAVACGGAAVASLLALNGGSGQASVDMIARYLGIAL
ncbi:site-2 protease family protein [Brevundimonas sp.]|uniref:metalloprotease n=1 Tax=Brevundimonas sp. TaxID=1871086 RepID=UPI002FC759F3